MILQLLVSLLFASNPCADKTHTHPEYANLVKQQEEKIIKASNLVTIATEADQVLSKLIAAKSPVLLSWLEKRSLMSKGEEEIAKEWRKYYLTNFIFARYPSKNSGINTSVENLFKEINDVYFPDNYKKQAEKVFNQAKEKSKAFVLNLKMDHQMQKKAIHKLDTMKLYWFEKLDGTRYANKPMEFTNWGVAYDPTHNEINMGTQARQYPTDANLFAVFAHEMGHSLDPCRWSSFFSKTNPFEKVIQCLRSDKSVKALARDDSQMESSIKNKLLTKDMAKSLKQNPTCNRSFYPPRGTQKDQILESFADWFSAEIFATSSFKSKFPRPDLCQTKELMKGSSYLSHLDRLQKIYLSHPQLAKLSKDSKAATYCPFN